MTKLCILSCGEPSGISREVVVKAWKSRGSYVRPFVVVGPAELYADYDVPVRVVTEKGLNDLADVEHLFQHSLLCLDLPGASVKKTKPGVLDLDNSRLALLSLRESVRLVQADPGGRALVTLPIEKRSFYSLGFPHPGHTEYLAHCAGLSPGDVVMMLAGPSLRTASVTTHQPLKDIPLLIAKDLLLRKVRIILTVYPDWRVAVAGLNPHAGEGGTIGREEEDIITPAVAHLQSRGLAVSGPHAADTLFAPPMRAQYDVALCMYHDQALIPVKTLDFYRTINVTLGLPFTRTSPDHGTALDIAGRNTANCESLVEAITWAAEDQAGRGTRGASAPRQSPLLHTE